MVTAKKIKMEYKGQNVIDDCATQKPHAGPDYQCVKFIHRRVTGEYTQKLKVVIYLEVFKIVIISLCPEQTDRYTE